MKYELFDDGVKIWVSDNIYYCTNKEGDGLFRVNVEHNSRNQLKGTCQFSVHGLKDKSKKAKIRKVIFS